MDAVSVVLHVGAFLSLWAGSALLLSCLPWFSRPLSLEERLAPHVSRHHAGWVADVEAWLQQVSPGE